MKKYIFVLLLMGLIASNAQAQQPVEVVKSSELQCSNGVIRTK